MPWPAPHQGLLDPAAMARLALGEALTNLVWARVTALRDVKASVNWMYAAKMDGEGADVYDAALALKSVPPAPSFAAAAWLYCAGWQCSGVAALLRCCRALSPLDAMVVPSTPLGQA